MRKFLIAAILLTATGAHAGAFPQGLVVTQVHIAGAAWPNDKPSLESWHEGQEVERAWRPVKGMHVDFECAGDCYIRAFGHVSFQLEGCLEDGKKTKDRAMLAAGLYIDGHREWWSVENLLRFQHYGDRPFYTARLLEPGEHRVEVRTFYRPMNDDSCVPFHKRSEQNELVVEVLEP